MIEYISNAIRATAGSYIEIAARIADDYGAPVTTNVHFMLFDEAANHIVTVDGNYNSVDDIWSFGLDGSITDGLVGRYWYCICAEAEPLCFKLPFYLVK